MRKKVISMFLALSLIVSGVPVSSVSAAELDVYGDTMVLSGETTNVDETSEENGQDSDAGNTDEMTEDAESAEKIALSADYGSFNLNSDGKVVGSDGVSYDDVVYLSVDTVAKLDANAQDDYLMLCDSVSQWIEDGAENIVIAADADGKLHWTFHVPGNVLVEKQQELINKTLAGEETAEEQTVSETETEKVSVNETETSSEETSTKETETVSEEFSTKETTETASEVETETSTEESTKIETETSTEELTEIETGTTTEESTEIETETAAEELTEIETETTTEESSVTDTATEEESVEEATTEEETKVEDEEIVKLADDELTAENMNLIPALENEQVEIADSAQVDAIDLGYGSNDGNGNGAVFNSTLPKSTYFSSQLGSEAKSVYNAASGPITKGNTTFSLNGGSNSTIAASISEALSALVLTYPDKTDWFDKPGGWSIVGDAYYNPSTGRMYPFKVGVDKSSYYSSTLDREANDKVEKIVLAAQKYATENRSSTPAYGVVEYFDAWLCESNYYSFVYGANADSSLRYPRQYYECHSAYGALLRGYAVCESYAKAMSRLLDAVGIPNMYVVGDAGGGHAWNYVQMPDGKWYLLDTTWNNPADDDNRNGYSTQNYLLVKDDGRHRATGQGYNNQRKVFKFATLNTTSYSPASESISFNKEMIELQVKATEKLECTGALLKSSYKTEWSSSNPKVAKVDSKGKITAVAPGTAVIKLSASMAGIESKAECTVNVYQVSSLLSNRTKKASDSLSIGIAGTTGTDAEAQTITLNVNVGENSPYTAEEMCDKKLTYKSGKSSVEFNKVITPTSSKPEIAEATATLSGNTIDVKIVPKAAGKTTVKVPFGGKTASISVTVGQIITEEMFEVNWSGVKGMNVDNKKIEYTGKAVKPKVTKTDKAPAKVKYKVTYLNNKDAGTAQVKISGTGKFGGEVIFPFEITRINIKDADFSKTLKSKAYNGGANAPAATVKCNKKTLKAGRDYKILYNGAELTTVPAGTYNISIVGIGNYEGTVSTTQSYTVNKNTIAKVTASCASKVKFTGGKLDPVTVKIGKNVLPESDYEIAYYTGTKTNVRTEDNKVDAPRGKGSYFAVVTVKGDNLTTTAKKKEIVKKFTVK